MIVVHPINDLIPFYFFGFFFYYDFLDSTYSSFLFVAFIRPFIVYALLNIVYTNPL